MGLIVVMTNSTCKSHNIAHVCKYAIVEDALYIYTVYDIQCHSLHETKQCYDLWSITFAIPYLGSKGHFTHHVEYIYFHQKMAGEAAHLETNSNSPTLDMVSPEINDAMTHVPKIEC